MNIANIRKKTKEQLKKDLEQKVKGIKNLLKLALDCKLESDERVEYSNSIATSLRAILFGDPKNDNKSLIHRVDLDEKLLFPIYDFMTCLNIVPAYNLLQFVVCNTDVKTKISDELFKTGGFWGAYATFDSWLNEIVIDTKLPDVEPLSRLLIIKIISDTIGAHVDDNVEEHIFNMNKHKLLPVVIKNGIEIKKDTEIATKSIMCESVLAIAKEFLDFYEIFLSVHPKLIGQAPIEIRVQKYLCSKPKFELIKYGMARTDIQITVNTYNSNSFFECDIYSKTVSLYSLAFNHRLFKFVVVNYKDILNGKYLGKSIYPIS